MKRVEAMIQPVGTVDASRLPSLLPLSTAIVAAVDYLDGDFAKQIDESRKAAIARMDELIRAIDLAHDSLADALGDHSCEIDVSPFVPVGSTEDMDTLLRREGFNSADMVAIVKLDDIEWRSVRTPPQVDTEVLALYKNSYGKMRRVRAALSGLHTLEMDSDSMENGCECGNCDGEYCKPGNWYEVTDNDDTSWQINGEVTHWMPLPGLPSGVS